VRYVKGSVNLNLKRDNALLKQVLDSRFVTQQQLWEFMLVGGQEFRRRSFNWRVKRLADNGFIERHSVPRLTSSYLYSLTAAGARQLLNVHQSHTGAADFSKHQPDGESVLHALDLNDIHLTLVRAGLLRYWKSELEITLERESTDFGAVKEYDAVITLQLDGWEVKVALEYERTAKADGRYGAIAKKIRQEQRVHRFLYLLPEDHRLWHLVGLFQHTGRALYFGVTSDFKRDLLSTRVVGLQGVYRTLKEALRA
jgi:DNA-binding MarR family transcriptional regulator